MSAVQFFCRFSSSMRNFAIPSLLRDIIMHGYWIMLNAFSASVDVIIWFFFVFSQVIWSIHWFSNFEPVLQTWNKSHLVVVYDYFYTLLKLIGQYFIENFCICVHHRYWSIAFLSCILYIIILASYNKFTSILSTFISGRDFK